MPSITKTLILVKAALSGQKDNHGVSMFDHCVRVSQNMEKLMKKYDIEDQNFILTALLHDIIEDSDITANDLYLFGYNNAVIDSVEHLTYIKENGSYNEYINSICENGTLMTLLTKLSDNLDNTDPMRYVNLTANFSTYLNNRYQGVREQLESAIAKKLRTSQEEEIYV